MKAILQTHGYKQVQFKAIMMLALRWMSTSPRKVYLIVKADNLREV